MLELEANGVIGLDRRVADEPRFFKAEESMGQDLIDYAVESDPIDCPSGLREPCSDTIPDRMPT